MKFIVLGILTLALCSPLSLPPELYYEIYRYLNLRDIRIAVQATRAFPLINEFFAKDCLYQVDENNRLITLQYTTPGCLEAFNYASREFGALKVNQLAAFITIEDWIKNAKDLDIEIELDLEFERVGNRGAFLIANAIESEIATLNRLNLEDNNINGQGLEVILYALENKGLSLQQLNLAGNPIGINGGMALTEALEKLPIKELKLYSRDFSNDDSRRLLHELMMIING